MLTQKLFFNVKSFVKSLVLKYLILYNGHLLNGTSCNMEVLFQQEKWSGNVISRYSTLISCTLEQSILVSPQSTLLSYSFEQSSLISPQSLKKHTDMFWYDTYKQLTVLEKCNCFDFTCQFSCWFYGWSFGGA